MRILLLLSVHIAKVSGFRGLSLPCSSFEDLSGAAVFSSSGVVDSDLLSAGAVVDAEPELSEFGEGDWGGVSSDSDSYTNLATS